MEPTEPHSRAAFWMIVILVLTTLGNIVASQMLPGSVRAVVARESGDLIHLVNTGQRTVAQRYGFYLAMGEQQGASLTIFPGAGVNAVLLGAFGRMELLGAKYDPSGHALPDLGEPDGDLRTDDLRVVPFWVIPGEPGDRFWLAEHEEGYAAVPESVLEFPG